MYTHCHLRVLTSLAVTSLYILSPIFFVLLCFHHSNHLHLFKIAAYMICLKLRQKEAEVEKIRTFIRSVITISEEEDGFRFGSHYCLPGATSNSFTISSFDLQDTSGYLSPWLSLDCS
uniref:Uncharacterized protein n=1 Tax=Nicotiana tabacum TaxID=4097 RepID=A0A1S3XW30_TOBAC|nr:PREDICTED: uncharacterized protein LOC107769446 [Nicotiana tabacum]XP_016444146.1 PREDICTED: uncharacterized protein LOC107769446 [Nicotiana tabacum]